MTRLRADPVHAIPTLARTVPFYSTPTPLRERAISAD
jgi:hypothetical protein